MSTALKVLYELAATLLVMYILAIALTGWFKKNLRKEVRAVLAVVGLISATLHPVPIAFGAAIVVALRVFGDKL
ncbi:hypothetical protein A3L12_00285 [Thermococcus sp. P6]|nr:hypothetical protein A3L12_00285 [Thermococcus sp. P6]